MKDNNPAEAEGPMTRRGW